MRYYCATDIPKGRILLRILLPKIRRTRHWGARRANISRFFVVVKFANCEEVMMAVFLSVLLYTPKSRV